MQLGIDATLIQLAAQGWNDGRLGVLLLLRGDAERSLPRTAGGDGFSSVESVSDAEVSDATRCLENARSGQEFHDKGGPGLVQGIARVRAARGIVAESVVASGAAGEAV